MTDRLPTLEEGRAERESLRADRARNYATKLAADFCCQEPDCKKNFGVLVVRTKDGLETRCVPHIGRHRLMPGQWYERSPI